MRPYGRGSLSKCMSTFDLYSSSTWSHLHWQSLKVTGQLSFSLSPPPSLSLLSHGKACPKRKEMPKLHLCLKPYGDRGGWTPAIMSPSSRERPSSSPERLLRGDPKLRVSCDSSIEQRSSPLSPSVFVKFFIGVDGHVRRTRRKFMSTCPRE